MGSAGMRESWRPINQYGTCDASRAAGSARPERKAVGCREVATRSEDRRSERH